MAKKAIEDLKGAPPNLTRREDSRNTEAKKTKLKASLVVDALNKELQNDSTNFIDMLATMQAKLFRDFLDGVNVKEALTFTSLLAKMTIIPESGENLKADSTPDSLIATLKNIISDDVKKDLVEKAKTSKDHRKEIADKVKEAMEPKPFNPTTKIPKYNVGHTPHGTPKRYNLADYININDVH